MFNKIIGYTGAMLCFITFICYISHPNRTPTFLEPVGWLLMGFLMAAVEWFFDVSTETIDKLKAANSNIADELTQCKKDLEAAATAHHTALQDYDRTNEIIRKSREETIRGLREELEIAKNKLRNVQRLVKTIQEEIGESDPSLEMVLAQSAQIPTVSGFLMPNAIVTPHRILSSGAIVTRLPR